jgi:mannose-1-phosphate guanylyltransferase/mannose-6-phosphate isomerase
MGDPKTLTRTEKANPEMIHPHLPVYPVLLAGGSGTRLWPVSRELYPKQLVSFIGSDSLIQSTIKRLSPVLDSSRVKIVCGKEHSLEISRHLESIGICTKGNVISEPCGRNTAPAILLALFDVLRSEDDAILCIFPADHVIQDVESFHGKLESAIRLAAADYIVTFGIQPGYPETGYGYIEGQARISEDALSIHRFVEKPDLQTARHYVEAGNYFWNSGMFAFKASVVAEEFKTFQPDLYYRIKTLAAASGDLSLEDYQLLPNISIDVAVMEKTHKGAVLPSDFGWSDIGSWKSLYDFLPKDENQNVLHGDVICNDSHHCFVMGHERLIAANHLDNVVIVETPDSIFVSDIENSRDVKSIVTTLREKGRWECQQHTTASKPWGSLTSLETKDNYRVGRMIVYPGSSVTVKAAASESKILAIVDGFANATIGPEFLMLHAGQSLSLAPEKQAVIENGNSDMLVMIQVTMAVEIITR